MHQFCHHMKSDEILRLKHCIDALTSCGSLCTPCMEKKKSPCSCGSIAYCSKRCQKAHWTAHKGQHWNSTNTTAMAATMSEHIERFAHENHFEMSDPFNRVVLHQFLSYDKDTRVMTSFTLPYFIYDYHIKQELQISSVTSPEEFAATMKDRTQTIETLPFTAKEISEENLIWLFAQNPTKIPALSESLNLAKYFFRLAMDDPRKLIKCVWKSWKDIEDFTCLEEKILQWVLHCRKNQGLDAKSREYLRLLYKVEYMQRYPLIKEGKELEAEIAFLKEVRRKEAATAAAAAAASKARARAAAPPQPLPAPPTAPPAPAPPAPAPAPVPVCSVCSDIYNLNHTTEHCLHDSSSSSPSPSSSSSSKLRNQCDLNSKVPVKSPVKSPVRSPVKSPNATPMTEHYGTSKLRHQIDMNVEVKKTKTQQNTNKTNYPDSCNKENVQLDARRRRRKKRRTSKKLSPSQLIMTKMKANVNAKMKHHKTKVRVYNKHHKVMPNALKAAVESYGGFVSVMKHDLWQHVCLHMHLPYSSKCTAQLTYIYICYFPKSRATLRRHLSQANAKVNAIPKETDDVNKENVQDNGEESNVDNENKIPCQVLNLAQALHLVPRPPKKMVIPHQKYPWWYENHKHQQRMRRAPEALPMCIEENSCLKFPTVTPHYDNHDDHHDLNIRFLKLANK